MSKPFNLEKALAGEPVVTRGGSKAYIIADLRKTHPEIIAHHPLSGFLVTTNGAINLSWHDTGRFSAIEQHSEDLVGMWQDKPQIDENGRYLSEPPAGSDFYFLNTLRGDSCVGFIRAYDPSCEDEKRYAKQTCYSSLGAATFESSQRNLDKHCPIENAKLVMYFGKVYSVPKSYEWIATDASGDVYAYESRPILGWVAWNRQARNCLSLGINHMITNWQNSLRGLSAL